MKEKRSSFSGSIGFVLAAAGSAVGVGNIWRFPYLCAKDGGGLFLLVYLVLVLTFGFVLLTTDVAIGRKTKKNALKAFEELNPKYRRSRTQRRKIQTCRYVPLYDPLCRSGRNARPVPCVYRIRRFDCIIYWILNVCGSGKKMLHFTFQYFQICSILQSCFCSDSVFLV